VQSRLFLLLFALSINSYGQSGQQPLTPTPGIETPARNAGLFASGTVRVLCLSSQSGGSGFLHRSGRILTASHVVAGCAKMQVLDSKGIVHQITAATADPKRDVALLTVDPPVAGTALALTSKPSFNVGIMVTTWGYPAGYSGLLPLLSVGYLAGEQRIDEGRGQVDRWIVNGAFNSGNSGGPLIEVASGTVIGIVSSKLTPIPQDVQDDLEALAAQGNGFTFIKTFPDGTKTSRTEGQLVSEILQYLRSQTQLVLGNAVKIGDIQSFLLEQKIEP
jgi:S1-C subfamily serine protease